MERFDPQPGGSGRLRMLLEEAGLKSFGISTEKRVLFCSGRTREWNIIARMNDDWLNLYTIICDLPVEPGLRARTLDGARVLGAA